MPPFHVKITTDDPGIEALCREYWAIDGNEQFPTKVAGLAERHGLRPHEVARVVREHSTARSAETTCAGCGEGMEFASRADFKDRRSWHRNWNRAYVCGSCAEENTRLRTRETEERDRDQRAALARWFALGSDGTLELDAIDFEQAVALLSVIRAGASEDLLEITPAESWPSPLSPTPDLDNETIKVLFDSGILAISETSLANAFEWEGLDPARFFRMKVSWHISDGSSVVPIAVVASEVERRFRERDWPEHWQAGAQALWLKLALHECLRFLELGLADHGLQKRIGEKTIAVINNALQDFAIGQVYNFIWRAVRDAAAYYMRGGVAKQQAANIVVRAVHRSAEQALANGWEVKSFRRDWRAPESVMSHTFAAAVTGLGDAYWDSVPQDVALSGAPGTVPTT